MKSVHLETPLQYKYRLSRWEYSIRNSWDLPIFIMGIHMSIRRYICIKMALYFCYFSNTPQQRHCYWTTEGMQMTRFHSMYNLEIWKLLRRRAYTLMRKYFKCQKSNKSKERNRQRPSLTRPTRCPGLATGPWKETLWCHECPRNSIRGFVCQKQVSKAETLNYIPQIYVITSPRPW